MGRETEIGVEEELIHLTKRLAFRIRRELDQALGAEGVTWAQFTRMDANGDGVVTLDEVRASFRGRGAAASAPSPPARGARAGQLSKSGQ